MGRRVLIVNADDFGYSPGVNRGIIAAHEQGVVTSASLMVRWPDAAGAATYARQHPEFSVGLHVDLGEWACVDGRWMPRYEVVSLDDGPAVTAEVARQLTAFRRLTGQDPTHLDSHQHVHRTATERGATVRSALLELARELSVPLRGCTTTIYYCGAFYGQTPEGVPRPGAISVEALLAILDSLPSAVTELGCHPVDAADVETTLCDPRVRAAVSAMGFELRSFRDVAAGIGILR
jgi:predicted glycoside hydrolase/deacetylase ChbG (UPF0249 family)